MEEPNTKGNMPQRIAERLVLLRDYLNANASRTRAVSIKDMRQYLSDNGDNCGIKPIYRALNILIANFDMQLEYSEKLKGWTLNNPPFTQHELRLIVDSVQASKFITQEKAKQLTNKIRKLTGAEGKDALNRQAYVYERVKSMNDSVVNDVDRIHQAILDDRQISFKYYHRTHDSRKPKRYSYDGKPCRVSPFALCWSNGNLYLYAFDGRTFRHYRVDRMEQISRPLLLPREGTAEYSEKNITARKAKVFNMYSGKEYNVQIRFHRTIVDSVIDEFGEQINMMYVDADHFTIKTPIELSPTFYAWIATFGKKAKILEPIEAINGMKKFISDMSFMYEDSNQ